MDDSQAANTATASILLVDDIPANLRVLYESLNGRNYRLFIANGGAQALEVAQRAQPDLVLLDIMMPDMDGFEVCRRLKQDPATAGMAVIFLSALDDTADKVRGLERGAVDYVTKPFQPDEVAARVAIHCRMLRLERELAHRNRQLELIRDRILNSMVEGVVGLDVDGHVSFVNPAGQRMLGIGAAELLGSDVNDWQPSRLREAVRRVLDSRAEVSIEDLSLPRPSAEPLPVELRIAPIAEDQQTEGAVLVLRDLSERRRAEAKLSRTSDQLRQSHRELKQAQMQLIQAAKLESVGYLAAGVAHEVKNPLAIVQLGLDYLQQTLTLDPTSAAVLADTQVAVARADTVIRGLLDFSRERALDLRMDDINRILDDSLTLIRHELGQRDIRLHKQLDGTIPERPFDAGKLQQVFINLFMNAMHAMQHGGTLHVSSRFGPANGASLGPQALEAGFLDGDRLIQVVVEDTGPGIEPRHLGRLFDPYFTTKRQGEGTGLGLSVSRNIVTLHRGSIDLDNRPEGGARAIVLFRVEGGAEGDESLSAAPGMEIAAADRATGQQEKGQRSDKKEDSVGG
jgi:PAS domain S-box-containing protein